ncbi:hypothetical protein ACJOWW_13170 [Acinetobacter baumannii]
MKDFIIEFFKEVYKFAQIVLNLRTIVYFLTFYFFLILILVMTFPLDKNQILHWGNLHISFKAINLGEFGGFLSGIFAPLAFLWLALNMKQQDTNLKIAEQQLELLRQEKENRRKALRAFFTIPPTKPENNIVGHEFLLFKVPAKSDSSLINCFTNGFENNSGYILSHLIPYEEKHLSSEKQNFKADEKFFIYIYIKLSTINTGPQMQKSAFDIHYLDSDGYQQKQTISIVFYRYFSNIDINSKSLDECGILFIQPLNN